MMLYLSIAPFKLNVVSVLINKCTLYTYIFFFILVIQWLIRSKEFSSLYEEQVLAVNLTATFAKIICMEMIQQSFMLYKDMSIR